MSGKKVLLDTNIVIDLLSGEQDVPKFLTGIDELLLPAIVVGELYYGAENSERRSHHLERIDAFLSKCSIVRIDERIAGQYGRLKRALKKKGRPLPENDIWIAATAITLDLQLISNDGHFKEMDIDLLSPDDSF